MNHPTTLLMKEFVTHDVLRFILSRPAGFIFEPGQGVDLSIDVDHWRDQSRPFTPTSSTIAGGVGIHDQDLCRACRHDSRAGRVATGHGADDLRRVGHDRLSRPRRIHRQGAGITPFLAILRHLRDEGRLPGHGLIFANKAIADVICEKKLRAAFGAQAHFVVERDASPGFESAFVDDGLPKRRIEDWNQHFYVCGSPPFNDAVMQTLRRLGAWPEALVFAQ